ncbi:IPExxxVDY family protein [Flavobacteriaceae bacterium TP-CH-4]|uniref:IPExxxVDY family protein n=1 Tax=Pelagihabitans pacificus TaxID=2696054 RepID=A0A967AR74_9FLAO|nr:IPExxxVDY family protein [Pelagihabitans pacificus]NHF58889.1 IPExxxVDY family protein [Pelagihabitans pacificus]
MAAVHKIMDDFYEDPFYLVALHSSLEDYELVYFINLHLKTKFVRCKEDLQLTSHLSFPIFEWKDETKDSYWSLIRNNSAQEESSQRIDLFEGEPSFTIHHLIPEHKEVDYFLKVEQDDFDVEATVLKPLLKVPKIITAYTIDANKLKSKNNLIFL